MSIDNQEFEVESGIESQKLQLFTDRHRFTLLFAEYLNDNEPHSKIVYFYGDGGNGKSLLLKFLQEKCCKLFPKDTWARLKAKSDAELPEVVEEIKKSTDWDGVKPVPSVMLDFGQQPRGEDQPQDPFYGLLMLRRNLGITTFHLEYRLKFPLYDFACIWYLHKKGKSSEEIKRLFPPEEVELICELLNIFTQSIWFNLLRIAFQNLIKRLSPDVTFYWQKRGLDEEWVSRLKAMEPDRELIDSLPYWFAQDLNAAMRENNTPPRVVLFFDTHEAFWGHQRNLPEAKFFYQDEWLRRLLRALELSSGIVVVVAGREEPRWSEATNAPIPKQFLYPQLVYHLSTIDAKGYLQNAGISDAYLQQSLINYASVVSDQVHPFFLGLCADVVLAAGKRGEPLSPASFASIPENAVKSRVLINRLLQYVDEDIRDAVHALSACRAFDQKLYLKLGKALDFHATAASFRILTRFSFVWLDKKGQGNWYRIHDLLRRLDYQEDNEITHRAHVVLEQHYREHGNKAEAIYHAICQDWNVGVKEWIEVFNSAKEQGSLKICRTLLEIWKEVYCWGK